jgi:hypothetical protein
MPVVKFDSTEHATLTQSGGIVGAYAINFRTRPGEVVPTSSVGASYGSGNGLPEETNRPNSQGTSNSFSPVVIAAITISVVFGLSLIAVIAWVFVYRARKRREVEAVMNSHQEMGYNYPPNHPHYSADHKQELFGNAVSELSGTPREAAELSAEAYRASSTNVSIAKRGVLRDDVVSPAGSVVTITTVSPARTYGPRTLEQSPTLRRTMTAESWPGSETQTLWRPATLERTATLERSPSPEKNPPQPKSPLERSPVEQPPVARTSTSAASISSERSIMSKGDRIQSPIVTDGRPF